MNIDGDTAFALASLAFSIAAAIYVVRTSRGTRRVLKEAARIQAERTKSNG